MGGDRSVDQSGITPVSQHGRGARTRDHTDSHPSLVTPLQSLIWLSVRWWWSGPVSRPETMSALAPGTWSPLEQASQTTQDYSDFFNSSTLNLEPQSYNYSTTLAMTFYEITLCYITGNCQTFFSFIHIFAFVKTILRHKYGLNRPSLYLHCRFCMLLLRVKWSVLAYVACHRCPHRPYFCNFKYDSN